MKAIIFDVDGVLVDSYEAHLKSWQMLAREAGVSLTEDDFARTFGRTSRDILCELFDPALNDETLRNLDDRKEALYRAIVEESFPAMPYAAELIKALDHDDWAIAAGSSGPPENVELCLARLEVRDCFDAVITGRDVTRGKPDPQVFQLAAQRMNVPAQRCVVIEDAPAGLEAARRAGMHRVGFVSTGRTEQELLDSDLRIKSFDEVSPEQLAQLLEHPL